MRGVSWGSKIITVIARCKVNIGISAQRSINVLVQAEEVSVTPPGGNVGPFTNVSYTYTSGAINNLGHPIERSYDWGDGTSSGWSTEISASHAWTATGPYTVTVTARCQTHPSITATSEALEVNVTDYIPGDMIFIPAGSFLMGNDQPDFSYDEIPRHSVNLSGYYIGKYEVTRGEYREFMNDGGYTNSDYWSTEGWDWKILNGRTEPNWWVAEQDFGFGVFTQTDNHPVVGVSYYEAEAFCNWAGGHLPTEAQWEKAARGTDIAVPNVYPWGYIWDEEKCNNTYDSLYTGTQTAPVGSYPSGASPYGCWDMAGNVWEWCKDWYEEGYYSSFGGWNDPQGPGSSSLGCRVKRGGGWLDINFWDENSTRCAARSYAEPAFDSSGFDFSLNGFRLAR